MRHQTKNSSIIVPVILGLTGIGKTQTLAQLDGNRYEVISCDSRQIYKGLEIATAAPSQVLQQRLTHHLISILAPTKKFSAGRFARLAQRKILQVQAQQKVALLAGGSGFYYRALQSGMFPVTTPKAIQKQVAAMSVLARLKLLRQIDPQALCAANETARNGRIHPNDDYRITRALEINLASGKQWLELWQETQAHAARSSSHPNKNNMLPNNNPPNLQFQGVWLDYDDIAAFQQGLLERAQQMVAAGIAAEAAAIYEKHGACSALAATLGSDLALQVHLGQTESAGLAERLAQAHWRYAKKQRNWFRRQSNLQRMTLAHFKQPARFEQFVAKISSASSASPL